MTPIVNWMAVSCNNHSYYHSKFLIIASKSCYLLIYFAEPSKAAAELPSRSHDPGASPAPDPSKFNAHNGHTPFPKRVEGYFS